MIGQKQRSGELPNMEQSYGSRKEMMKWSSNDHAVMNSDENVLASVKYSLIMVYFIS
jgi:hypothetical protein